MTATTMTGRRGAALLCLLPVLVAGCLTMDEPDPTPTLPPATPTVATPSPDATEPPPSEAPRDEGELVIALPELPDRLLPPANDMADTIALDLVHRTLYRLDEELRPVPDLAAGQPAASRDGRTWTIDLDLAGARFASGRPVTAEDVAGSVNLARSPVCVMERDVCGTTLAHVDSAKASEDGSKLTLVLQVPYSPLLAEVLARLPVLDMTAIDETAAGILSRAGELDPGAPDKLVTAVYRALDADECIAERPPEGCRMADHQEELEAMLTGAGVALPRLAPYTDPTGQVDRAAYATALLDRVAALGQLLTTTGLDRRAAALGLVDGFAPAFGAGPYRVTSVDPGKRMLLTPVPGQSEPPAIGRIVLEVVTDPSVAATRLQSGDLDWVPRIDQSLADAINGSGRPARAGVRPLDASWVVVFNTRRGRPYADGGTRRAFAECIDRGRLTETVGGGEAIEAETPLAAGSWGMEAGQGGGRALARGNRRLDLAGWVVGPDGIRERDGKRLSSTVALRDSQVRLLAMMQAAAEQLRECGIELIVEDLDVTGDRLLEQLRWPNDFDTLLTLRSLGVDPDADLQAFESQHATTADRPMDSNPGGFRDAGVDRRVTRARTILDPQRRTRLYHQVQDLLTTEMPAWWVWYETGWSAVADRVRGPDGEPIDTTRPRYEHDIRDWTLAPSPSPTGPSVAASASPPGSREAGSGSPAPSAEPSPSASGPP
ncbi:MAG: ABC transporter substrate-binding protein [Candidatus Limnocylindrales bacterium]